MAAAEMYDYLPIVTPDVVDELNCNTIQPKGFFPKKSRKNIKIIIGDDESEERMILSSQSVYVVSLQWDMLTAANHGTLVDLYDNSSKACGEGKSFYLIPPTSYDGHTYIARFVGEYEDHYRPRSIWMFKATFKILGKKPDNEI